MIYIVDHGSQYTGLISKKLGDLDIRSRILSPNAFLDELNEKSGEASGVIISGSPKTISNLDREWADSVFPLLKKLNIPTLGICYGFQLIALQFGSKLIPNSNREYGSATISLTDAGNSSGLFKDIPSEVKVWMSHSHSIEVSEHLEVLATSDFAPSAISVKGTRISAVLHHPEVHHSEFGDLLLKNFVDHGTKQIKSIKDWSPFLEELKESIHGINRVACAVSGGVDSTVLAVLLSRYCSVDAIYVDHGFQRSYDLIDLKNVFKDYPNINLHVLNEEPRFLKEISGIQDPEQKRKVIGQNFIDAFGPYVGLLGVDHFAQGTIASDVIESGLNDSNTAQKIKSHHNVGGLPAHLPFKLIEPLRSLYKDQVRSLGSYLSIPADFISRHPFPGPGLSIRCLGQITPERIQKLRQADQIFHEELMSRDLYHQTWQAGVILLPIRSTGVMGDESSYEECLAIRMVDSIDAMTADSSEIPWKDLKAIARRITNEVKGINRVVYDLTSKPPATIEWE